MRIIIVGIGKVGYTVAEQLVSEGHDVTVIDKNVPALTNAISDLDVIGIRGNGAVRFILEDASVAECDLLIALTGSDEVNLLCALLAKKLGAKDTIARVRNPEYNNDLALINDTLGLSMVINPEREAASEIFRILEFPFARNVEVFAKGTIDLVSFVAEKHSKICNIPLREFFKNNSAQALICAVKRGDNIYTPYGDFVILENDTVAVLASRNDIVQFFRNIDYPVNIIKSTMIIGGGKIAQYLATSLAKFNIHATIIEKDKTVAETLSLALPKATVICGDGTDRSLLLEEGLRQAGALCCLTGFDEENILLSLFARSIAPNIKTITKINKTAFQDVVQNLDIGSVVYPKYITANLILRHVRAKHNSLRSDLENLYKIIDNKVEALEFHVGSDSTLVNKTLKELKLQDNVIIGCINRNDKIFIPHGQDRIIAGDSVIVVTTTTGLSDLDDIIG